MKKWFLLDYDKNVLFHKMANLRQLILFNQQNKKQCEHALDIRNNELNAYFKKLVLVLKYCSILYT